MRTIADEDAMYEALGEEVERHPICSPDMKDLITCVDEGIEYCCWEKDYCGPGPSTLLPELRDAYKTAVTEHGRLMKIAIEALTDISKGLHLVESRPRALEALSRLSAVPTTKTCTCAAHWNNAAAMRDPSCLVHGCTCKRVCDDPVSWEINATCPIHGSQK